MAAGHFVLFYLVIQAPETSRVWREVRAVPAGFPLIQNPIGSLYQTSYRVSQDVLKAKPKLYQQCTNQAFPAHHTGWLLDIVNNVFYSWVWSAAFSNHNLWLCCVDLCLCCRVNRHFRNQRVSFTKAKLYFLFQSCFYCEVLKLLTSDLALHSLSACNQALLNSKGKIKCFLCAIMWWGCVHRLKIWTYSTLKIKL